MKKLLISAAVVLGMTACTGKHNSDITLNNFSDSLSYALGNVQGNFTVSTLNDMPAELKDKINKEKFYEGFCAALMVDTTKIAQISGADHGAGIWQQIQIMKHAGVDVNVDKLLSGFKAGINVNPNDSACMEEASSALFVLMNDVNSKILEFQRQQQSKMLSEASAQGKVNQEAGRDYAAKQRLADPSLQLSESGLIYKELRASKGPKPTENDTVKVIYTGKLIDGSVFDSSNGEAVEFPVQGVIPGFKEALLMMNKGSQYHIIIPTELGYGLQAPEIIGPNSYLVFDLELVDIVK